MLEKSFITFQISYLKSFIKHASRALRENKIIRSIQNRNLTKINNIYKDAKLSQMDRDVALRKIGEINSTMKSLYKHKSFDIDGRFERGKSLYKKFPLYVIYKTPSDNKRIHNMSNEEIITSAHILYNKLRHKKRHLKMETEHEYNHSLAYWAERLSYLYEEECSRIINQKKSVIEVGA